jgi:hypothetical protein
VVGGLAVLGIGALLAFSFIRKRNREHTLLAGEHGTHPYSSRPHIHGRSISDFSGKSIFIPPSVSMAHSLRPGTMYTTGTTHTHNGSVHSLSYNSGYTSPARVVSPSPAIQVVSREEVIEPFTLRATSPPVSMGRKGSETTMRTAYNNQESSESPPVALGYDASSSDSSERTRLNPPAYSPYASPASSPEPTDPTPQPSARPGHRTRAEKGSVDSQQSYDSTSRGGDSISAIDDVIGRMGLTMQGDTVAGSTVGGHTVSTGQSTNVVGRTLYRPNVSNPDDNLG